MANQQSRSNNRRRMNRRSAQQRSETVYSLIFTRDIRAQISRVLSPHQESKNKYASKLDKLIMQEDDISYFDIYLFISIHCFEIYKEFNNEEIKTLLEKIYSQSRMFHLREKVPRTRDATKNKNYSSGDKPTWRKGSNGEFILIKGDPNYRRTFESMEYEENFQILRTQVTYNEYTRYYNSVDKIFVLINRLKENDGINDLSERNLVKEFIDNKPTNTSSSNNSPTQQAMSHLDQKQYQVNNNNRRNNDIGVTNNTNGNNNLGSTEIGNTNNENVSNVGNTGISLTNNNININESHNDSGSIVNVTNNNEESVETSVINNSGDNIRNGDNNASNVNNGGNSEIGFTNDVTNSNTNDTEMGFSSNDRSQVILPSQEMTLPEGNTNENSNTTNLSTGVTNGNVLSLVEDEQVNSITISLSLIELSDPENVHEQDNTNEQD